MTDHCVCRRYAMLSVFAIALSSVCAAADDTPGMMLRTISGASTFRSGPDGSIYVISPPGAVTPTSGSWLQSCGPSYERQPSLSRVALETSRVLWTTCLPFRDYAPVHIDVDARTGAAVIAGVPVRDFPVTVGALNPPRITVGVPGEEIGVVRVRPDGSAADLATLIASTADVGTYPRAFDNVRGVAALPDGSVLVAARTLAPDLPVTSDAVDRTRSAGVSGYLARFSADGTSLMHATYLNRVTDFSDLEAAGGGLILLSGIMQSASAGYGESSPLAVPGVSPSGLSKPFIAAYSPSSSNFRFFRSLDMDTNTRGPAVAALPGGRSALAVAMRSEEAAVLVMEIEPDGTHVSHVRRIPAPAIPTALRRADSGRMFLAVNGNAWPPPVTANSPRLPFASSQFAILGLAPGGAVDFSTPVAPSTGISALELGPGNTLLAALTPLPGESASPKVSSPEPLTFQPDDSRPLFYAYPKQIQTCRRSREMLSALLWDVRDVAEQGVVEVRKDSPVGPAYAQGSTGVAKVSPGRYYLMLNPQGGPFSQPRILATEEVVTSRPLTCSSVETPKGSVDIVPNPILSCISPANTGTIADVWGIADSVDILHAVSQAGTEIHVNSPAGPVFVAGPGSQAHYQTADWVRNGMEFFLTSPAFPGVPLASQRAYLLPIRDCAKPDSAMTPAIRATRDCKEPGAFTLAFYTGERIAVEIRADSPSGEAVARWFGPSGLVDVRTSRPTTYYLMKFDNAKWTSLASVNADPNQPCEQGATR